MKKVLHYFMAVVLILSSLGLTAFAGADPVTVGINNDQALELDVTFYDFSVYTDEESGDIIRSHPDFQINPTGLLEGLVEKDLYVDGNKRIPKYNEDYVDSENLKPITPERFDEWFMKSVKDGKDVNIEIPGKLYLQPIDGKPGVYGFGSNSFFPLDDRGFGKEGRSNNFHFTMKLHAQFTYQEGQEFTFTGDDDVWVFINKKRVIDLGGVRIAKSDTVKLDALNLTEGETYDFDLFFAERRTSHSNFKMETSIVLKPTTYELMLLSDPENSADVTGAGDYAEGENVPINAVPKPGYKFDGWFDGDDLVSEIASFGYKMPASPKTLVAKMIPYVTADLHITKKVITEPDTVASASFYFDIYETETSEMPVDLSEYDAVVYLMGESEAHGTFRLNIPASKISDLGTITYWVQERDNGEPGWVYDTERKEVVFSLIPESNVNGTSDISQVIIIQPAKYTGSVEFTNTYKAPSLLVTKTVNPVNATIPVNGTTLLNYTVTVTNNGGYTLYDLYFEDYMRIPAAATNIYSVIPDDSFTADDFIEYSGARFTNDDWSVLEPTESITFSYQVTVNQPGVYDNLIAVYADYAECEEPRSDVYTSLQVDDLQITREKDTFEDLIESFMDGKLIVHGCRVIRADVARSTLTTQTTPPVVVTTGNLVVRHETEVGTLLNQEPTRSGNVGTGYTTSAQSFDGYELLVTPANASGTYTSGTITVVYTYAEIIDEIIDEPLIPEAPVVVDAEPEPEPEVIVEDEIEDILDEVIPEDVPEMPQTSGVPAGAFYFLGALLTGTGFKLKKRF